MNDDHRVVGVMVTMMRAMVPRRCECAEGHGAEENDGNGLDAERVTHGLSFREFVEWATAERSLYANNVSAVIRDDTKACVKRVVCGNS
jgi:hypothetical protein